MSKQPRTSSLIAAKEALAELVGYDAFLEKLSPKDRLNVTRHLEATEVNGDMRHSQLWRRLATAMMTLAPHFAKTDGQQRIRFFVPDGPYRMQVFAMEDLRDGVISVYCGDALDEAAAGGLVTPRKPPNPDSSEPSEYMVNDSQESIGITKLGNDTHVPAPFYKDMLGWNRKALCIRLPETASPAQAEAVELLCALSLIRAGKAVAGKPSTAKMPAAKPAPAKPAAGKRSS